VTFTGFLPFSGLAVKAAASPAPASLGDVDFQQVMLRLLPRGRVWRRDPGSTLAAVMLALAPTYTRGMQAAAQVLIDASPATTQNLLAEWEKSLGLPDVCTAANPSIEQRQAALRAKWGARGSLTIDNEAGSGLISSARRRHWCREGSFVEARRLAHRFARHLR
jgi:hypothetical protein